LRFVGPVPGGPLRDHVIGFDSRLPGCWVGARIKKMENGARADIRPEPPPRCGKCGKELKFIGAILDSAKGRNIRRYECQCGDGMWTSHKA
jgi:hypothetical protein